MFIVLALILVARNVIKNSYIFIILSGILFFIAILTKTTAVCLLPLFLLIIINNAYQKESVVYLQIIKKLCLFVGIVILFYLNYYYLAVSNYGDDYFFFYNINIKKKFDNPNRGLLRDMFSTAYQMKRIAPILFMLTLTVGGFLGIFQNFREKPLVIWTVVLIFLYSTTIGLSGYNPPRYYLPIAVPFLILVAVI